MHSQQGSRSVAWLAGLVSAVCAFALLAALVGASPAAAQATAPECRYPGADAFDGTSLDLQTRWTSTLRHDATLYTIADGKAKLQTGPYEIQPDTGSNPNPGAPNIFLQPAPAGTWEITTKVKIDQTHAGQQAGLLVADPTGNDIVKLTYVQKQDGAGGNKWVEFLKIVDGQYDMTGVWHSPESPDYPDELMLRYRSDGDTLSGWYSVDNGQTWLSAGDPRNYDAIDNPQVGFYALRGNAGNPAVTAEFDSFNLVPANDEFDGTAIDECRWTDIRNRNDAGMSVGNGELTLRTLQGELSNDQSGVQNLLLQNTNDSDWQATTKVTMSPTAEGQQAGLVIWGDNTDPAKANYVKLVFVRKNGDATNNAWIEFLKTTDGATEFGDAANWNSGLGDYGPTVYLRLVSSNDQLIAYRSADGETWTKVGKTHALTGIQNPKVGLMALKGTDASKPEVDAKFDWFRIEPGEIAPPAEAPDCLTQAEPETGFTNIFDGTQASFDQWKHAGGGSFTLADGAMTSTNTAADPNLGLHWYEPKQYRNFSVRMQWKLGAATDNSGVFARFPNPGNDPGVAIDRGHEIQINENPGGDVQKTGSIYNADRENHRNARPLGEWNDYEITVVGQKYTVCLNGKVVNEYTSDKGRPLEGFIGVQNHDPASKVSFRDVRVKELPDAPAVQGLFDTIGITQADTRANGEIYGSPERFSFIGEEMPPSRSVGIPGNDEDAVDDVPLRMPDTRGNVPNLASFAGQEYVLTSAQRKAYSQLHFFGTATDAGGDPGGGDFTLTFADGSTEKVNVMFRDWVNGNSSPGDHPAVVADRITTGGTTSGPFYIFHIPKPISEGNRGKVLTSITLPPDAGRPGNLRAYLMALTLEEAGGTYEMPILAGNADFPNDLTPPVSSATVDPAQPDGLAGWYKRHVAVTLESADEEGGSQLESIEYRIDGGPWLPYEDEPVLVDTDGDHDFQYRAVDRAGNLESQKTVDVKIDTSAPEVDAALVPGLPAGTEWYDRAVRLELDALDRNGSGIDATQYAIDGGAWQEYTAPVVFDEDGDHEVAYRAVDVAGNTGDTVTVPVRVDRTAPATTVRLDGAAPLGTYGQPVTVELSGTDGDGSGVLETAYRLDGGEWTVYTGPFTVSALGLHRVEYTSTDEAGNPEAVRQVAFNRVDGTPTTGGQGTPTPTPPAPIGGPAPKPAPWTALGAVRRSQSKKCTSNPSTAC
jgi:beta-xylosidase